MHAETKQSPMQKMRAWYFPLFMAMMYGVIFFVSPQKARTALCGAGNATASMLLSLGLVFVVMLLMNLFLKPAQVAKLLTGMSGFAGALFSILAGIISTGPIYAWYPLLQDLKKKGAGSHIIAIFLHNRSVKPFLLPVMISFFGLTYVLILIITTVLASLALGYAMKVLVRE